MRKITEYINFDKSTFGETLLDIWMLEGGAKTLLSSCTLETHKFTPAQLLTINRFNKALIDNDLPVMTEEEANWAVGKHLISRDVNTTEEELQRLAGYKVEKKITYLDQNSAGVE
jgi:hypothetical protein